MTPQRGMAVRSRCAVTSTRWLSFAPAVRTDANGQTTVDFTVPDNLTRYRIMVVAVAEG